MTGRNLTVATAALATASLLCVAAARAADPSAATQPGFVPASGQINPGHAAQPWSAAPPLPQDQQPAQEDARAALMMPDNGAPSAGRGGGQATGQATPPAPNGGGQSTSGQPSGGQSTGDNASNTTGTSGGPAGPIGATLQTMPAKFSHRNDLLDHMPMMALPLPLNAQQRQHIYQGVMRDKAPPA